MSTQWGPTSGPTIRSALSPHAVAQPEGTSRPKAGETARDRLRTQLHLGTGGLGPEATSATGKARQHAEHPEPYTSQKDPAVDQRPVKTQRRQRHSTPPSLEPPAHPTREPRAGRAAQPHIAARPERASQEAQVDTGPVRRKKSKEPQHISRPSEHTTQGRTPADTWPARRNKSRVPPHIATTPEHTSQRAPADTWPGRRQKSKEPQHIAKTSEHTSQGNPADPWPARRNKSMAPPQHIDAKVSEQHAGSLVRHESVTDTQEWRPPSPERAPEHRASRPRIYCGNNALAHELTSGVAVLGTRSTCFRKGVGGGLYAKIPSDGLEEFMDKWTSPYRKLIDQPLHYGDGPTPPGKIPATLSQCLARSFAVGSKQKAEKILKARRDSPDTETSGPATRTVSR